MAFTQGLHITVNSPVGGYSSPFGLNTASSSLPMAMTTLASMLTMLSQMSQGGCPMSGCNPEFGAWGPSGSLPLNDFLGCQNGNSIAPSGSGRYRAENRSGTPSRSASYPQRTNSPEAPAPSVNCGSGLGNIDVERLVSALPRNRQNSARTHFPIIIREAQRQGVQSKPELAYMLATANHESGSGLRMLEIASGRAYEGRRGLGNTQPGDGPRFRGRGYVQITGRRNYTDWSRRLGIDLVNHPELAEQPEVAARILVGGMRGGTFTGRRLDRYIRGNRIDFDGARRTIGGGRGADRVSEVARRLLAAMR